MREKLRGKRVLIFTGGYKSWSVVSAMQDLGMIVVATGTEKSTEEDKARIRELMGPDARMISDNDQTALIDVFNECEADILIAGDRYIYPTLKSRIPFLDIDHVRRIGYAGYDGLIELASNLDHAVHSPVWGRCAPGPPGRAPTRRARGGVREANMAEIVLPTKALSVNPLKASQPIGASLAFLGLAECMPLEHGARGCTSFNKLYFMRHFNEPIALQTTAMDQTTTVLGADDNVVEALATICAKNAPAVIGLVTTGLSEMQGADVPRTVEEFRQRHPEFADVAVVPVSASDTLGCLETGFATAVESIIATLVPSRPSGWKNRRQVNVLASSCLRPGDLEELRAWIEAFGLTPILLPDIAASLDGHLIEQGFSTLTYGGVTREEIEAWRTPPPRS